MDITAILELIQLATGLIQNITGGKAQATIATIAQLEAIASKVAEAHLALTGTPLNVDSLKYEPPLP